MANKKSLNLGIIKSEESINKNEQTYPVMMTKTALRKFIHYFEEKLAERYFYFPTGQKLTYKQIIEKQVRLYADALENGKYKSFTL